MDYATKMLMIPQDAYSRLVSHQQQQTKPAVNELSNLDEQMQSILANPNIPADVKYSQYDQVLRRYRFLNERQQQPLKIEFTEQPKEFLHWISLTICLKMHNLKVRCF